MPQGSESWPGLISQLELRAGLYPWICPGFFWLCPALGALAGIDPELWIGISSLSCAGCGDSWLLSFPASHGVVPFPSHPCGRRALFAAPQGHPVSKATEMPREQPECLAGNTPGHGAVPAAATRAQIPALLLREEGAQLQAVPSPVTIQGCHLPSAPAGSATS